MERDSARVVSELDPLDEMVERACGGDEEGFRLLWSDLQPRLLRHLRVTWRDDADDLASETWATVVRDLHKFRGNGRAFRSWLFTVARRRAIDDVRYRSRLRRTPNAGYRTVAACSAEEETTATFSTEEALALVAELPARQAEAVSLRIIVQLDTETAASIVGCSPESIRVNLHRGLQALARDPRVSKLQETA